MSTCTSSGCRPTLRNCSAPHAPPRQELVLGYWDDILNCPADELNAAAAEGRAKLRATRLPYLMVASEEVDYGYRDWLKQQLPQASIVVLTGSGHFPHLAHPDMFARCLADTADWPLRATS